MFLGCEKSLGSPYDRAYVKEPITGRLCRLYVAAAVVSSVLLSAM